MHHDHGCLGLFPFCAPANATLQSFRRVPAWQARTEPCRGLSISPPFNSYTWAFAPRAKLCRGRVSTAHCGLSPLKKVFYLGLYPQDLVQVRHKVRAVSQLSWNCVQGSNFKERVLQVKGR